jgi:hypothetical protein
MFDVNATCRTPIAQSGTGCQDVSSPKLVCKHMDFSQEGCYTELFSKVTSKTIMRESYSATFTRVAFTWSLNTMGPIGFSNSVDAMTTLMLRLKPDGTYVITDDWNTGHPAPGASDIFEKCLNYC